MYDLAFDLLVNMEELVFTFNVGVDFECLFVAFKFALDFSGGRFVQTIRADMFNCDDLKHVTAGGPIDDITI